MKYNELKKLFREYEATNPEYHMTGYITFTADSFNRPFEVFQRTYRFSSDNKAFKPNMGGYSIFGNCIDGTDPLVRLDWYMYDETGKEGDWKVEDCSIEIAMLSRVVDREIDDARFFRSCEEATDTMLLEFIRIKEKRDLDQKARGDATPAEKMEIANLRSALGGCDGIEKHVGDDAGYSYRSAWVNDATNHSNWDWKIQHIQVREMMILGNIS